MLINYKENRPWTFHYNASGKTTGIMNTKSLPFWPGVNSVSDEEWEKYLAKHPSVQQMIKDGHLEIVTKEAGKEKTAEGESAHPELSKLKVSEAVAIVEKIFNKDLLEKMLEDESRVKVKYALEKQLKGLELTPEELKAAKGQ